MASPDIGIRIDIVIRFRLSLGKESPCGKLTLSDKGLIISSSLMVGPVGKKINYPLSCLPRVCKRK